MAINEKIYNLKLTKEEEKYLQEQLKRYREEKVREKEIEEAKYKIIQLASEIDILCSDYNLALFYGEYKFDSDNLYFV